MILTPLDFFVMTTNELEHGEVERWISPATKYWLRVESTALAKIEFIRWGRELTGALPYRTDIS